jgi:hypothetical protein
MKTNITQWVTTGEAAKRIGVSTQEVSNAVYRGFLNHDDCPVLAGRRMIPVRLLPKLRKAIESRKRRRATTAG